MRLKILTELLFLIPLVIALFLGLYLYSAIILCSIIVAILYHLNHEKKFFYTDVIVSLILIATNLYFAYLSDFKYPYFNLAVVSLIASAYFWFKAQKKNYDLNHSMWHISSVLITIFCILSYT